PSLRGIAEMGAATLRVKRCLLLAAVLILLPGTAVLWVLSYRNMKNLRADYPGKPIVDRPAASLHKEEVCFDSGDHTLAGVLVLPTTPGLHPAVAFVHGSGSQDRNDWTLHPPLREHFARHGIASLCWDKPGVGASGGDWTRQSFHDRAQEAVDAVK